MKLGEIPAIIDTGAQFSCVRADVVEYLYLCGEPCVFSQCDVTCVLADGKKGHVSNAAKLRVGLLSFTWCQEFKVLNEGPFPVILGLDFLKHTQMRVDVAAGSYGFAFAPQVVGRFSPGNSGVGSAPFLQQLSAEAAELTSLTQLCPENLTREALGQRFPQLFSASLGTAKCAPYDIELTDTKPVRSAPYRCAPPRARIFKQAVDELLQQGVVRPSKSQYASPAFLVPKSDGGFRLVVDYRKVNAKVVFDSHPTPTIEEAFQQFGGAAVFSVLDLNSAYFQIPLNARSRRVTAFCTPFGLYEFNKLPMGISIGSQGLTRVINKLFSEEKGNFVFNYLGDVVVYSRSMQEHADHLRVVLGKLQEYGFTLNPDKITIAASEIKYLGHLLSARGIRVLPERTQAIQSYPPPKNLRTLRRFIGMTGFYARFIPDYSRRAAPLHALKRKGAKFEWGDEQQAAFVSLKGALSEAPVLQVPDFNKEFVLVTDASDCAISAVLNQRVGKHLAPVSYYSRLLSAAERRYSTYERECLAVLFGCERCRSYLEHKEFELQCDN
jgi:hypothetical protein